MKRLQMKRLSVVKVTLIVCGMFLMLSLGYQIPAQRRDVEVETGEDTEARRERPLHRIFRDLLIQGSLAVQSPRTGEFNLTVFDDGVGIGTRDPLANFHVSDETWIMGASSGFPDFGVTGWLTSLAGNFYEGGGEFWAHHFSAYGGGDIVRFGTSGGPGEVPDIKVVIDNVGNVGIGTTSPGEKLSVTGTIESTTGGFKFPDGTVQTTAAGSAGGGGDILYTDAVTGGRANKTTFSIGSGGSDLEEFARIAAPRSGILANLFVVPSEASAAFSSMTVTVRVNSADTVLSVTHTSDDGANVKSNIVDSVIVMPGDLISVKFHTGSWSVDNSSIIVYRASFEFK